MSEPLLSPDRAASRSRSRSPAEIVNNNANTEDIEVKGSAWMDYWNEDVSAEWGDLVLIVGCFATGLLDAAVFNKWQCFVSMQTGNTVYVGLGVSGQPVSQPHRWAKSGTSIVCFALGSFLFSRLMRALGAMRRGTLTVATLLQAALTICAAVLSETGVVPGNAGDLLPDNCIVLLPLALLAAQAGGQCVLSRVLGYGEIPTVVLTSSYCDLAMDQHVFAPLTENSKRNRRLAAVAMVVLGATLGGFLTIGNADIALALWVVAAIKVAMALSWVFWNSHGRLRLP